MAKRTQSPDSRHVGGKGTIIQPAGEPHRSGTGAPAGNAAAKQDVRSVTWPSAVQPKIRHKKAMVSLRLDRDVIEWFRDQGFGYQTRMNAVLRAYAERARTDAGKEHP